jgi:hypothetical protein
MTMQEQKKKLKKSYDERLHEIKLQMRKTVGELGYLFIPELCELLKEEHSEYTNQQIQQQVTDDCCDIWETSSIYKYLPSWIHNQKQVEAAKKRWETKNADKLKNLRNVSKIFDKVDLPEANIQQPDRGEELDQEMHELGLAKFGETKKSLRELKGRIYESADYIFKALTDKDSPPDESDDLMVDYIKPTREFRRSLILELDEGDRTLIYNKLHYASVAIEDMLNIIKETK